MLVRPVRGKKVIASTVSSSDKRPGKLNNFTHKREHCLNDGPGQHSKLYK